MPLVFIAIILIYVVVKISESKKKKEKSEAVYAKDRRKTNATLERNLVDKYMKDGYSFDGAFLKAYEDMAAAGYEPCIPKSAYSKNRNGVQSSYCCNPREYDSFLVNEKRNLIKQEWVRLHPGEPIPYENFDEEIYKNFPMSDDTYLIELKALSTKSKAIPVGEYLIYPGLGTCEVLAHNYIGDGFGGGTYTLRVLSRGDIVTSIAIGDPKITQPGKN